jgi:hypothetical protein
MKLALIALGLLATTGALYAAQAMQPANSALGSCGRPTAGLTLHRA